MRKTIAISSLINQVLVGIVEDGHLSEFFLERENQQKTVGNIYKGKVENVLPGMSAAFLNIGLERNAFLYVDSVKDVVRVGDELVVQVTKEPVGGKGARVVPTITLPGRYLVLLPKEEHLGISRQISDGAERERLRQIAEEIKPKGMGLIVRTVAEGKSKSELIDDGEYLVNQWAKIQSRARKQSAPALLYKDYDLVYRIIRDLLTDDIQEIIVDQPSIYRKILEITDTIDVGKTKIELYKGRVALFDYLGLSKDLERVHKNKVWLDCGGYLIIDQTEALVSIDVNTGKYVGNKNLADTVLKTNIEAAQEIAKQLRLRNIGGIIIIDFIDMNNQEDREKVLEALKAAVAKDRTRSHVLGFTQLGLVEMTRKKSKKFLSDMLETTCSTCQGTGRVLADETHAFNIAQHLFALAKEPEVEGILVKCNPSVASFLIGNSGVNLQSLEEDTGVRIFVKGCDDFSPEDVEVTSGALSKVRSEAYPVEKGDRLIVTIDSPHEHNNQNGIARLEGFVIDVEQGGKLTGKQVEVSIREVHRTFAQATIERVIS